MNLSHEIRTELVDLSTLDREAYQKLLTGDPGNLIYSSWPFLKFLQAATRSDLSLVVAWTGEEMAGAFPLATLETAEGTIVNSLPWWGSHGSALLSRSGPDAQQIREALIRRFGELMKDRSPLAWTVVLLPEEDNMVETYVDILQPTAFDARIGQVTHLPEGGSDIDSALMKGYRGKTRNLVRKGLRQGFEEVVTDEVWGWDFLIATHAANMKAIGGRAKPADHFWALREFLPSNNRRLSLAMDGGRPVAALLTLEFNGTAEYFTPVVEVAERSRQPLSFLILKGMAAAARAGNRLWNWGGTWSEQDSLHHFKAGFGARDVPYRYLISASPETVDHFRSIRTELPNRFPYFYTYPYSQLE